MQKKPLGEREVQLSVLDHLYKTGGGTNPHIKQANEKGVDIRVQKLVLDMIHHCTVITIKGESYRFKNRD